MNALAMWITASTVDLGVVVAELRNIWEFGDPVEPFKETLPITLGIGRRVSLIQTLLQII